MTIEECLRDIRGKAAVLRCVATSETWNDQTLTRTCAPGWKQPARRSSRRLRATTQTTRRNEQKVLLSVCPLSRLGRE